MGRPGIQTGVSAQVHAHRLSCILFNVSSPRGSVYIYPLCHSICLSHLNCDSMDPKGIKCNTKASSTSVPNPPKLPISEMQQGNDGITVSSSPSLSHVPSSSAPRTLAPSIPLLESTNSASLGSPSQDTRGKGLTKPLQESALTAPYPRQSPNSSTETEDGRGPPSE